MDRPLDGMERQFWHVGRVASVNVVAAAQVEGPLEVVRLRAALDAAQGRHPALRARVVEGPEGPRFQGGAGPLPLRVARGDGVAEVEAELAAPFPEEGPLLRAVWVAGADGGRLLLAYHHVLGDAMAGYRLAGELVTSAGSPDPPRLPPLPPAPSAASLVQAAEARGSRARKVALALQLLAMRLGAGMPPPFPRDGDAPPEERRTRVVPRALEPAGVRALAARCRAEGTTVHGALCAATLLATREALGLERSTALGCTSAVDLRRQLPGLVGASFGFHALAAPWAHIVGPRTSFWPLARAVRAHLGASLEGGDVLRHLVRLERRIPRTLDPQVVRSALARRGARQRAGVGVTNLGRLEPVQAGALRLAGFGFAASVAAGSTLLLAAATLEERMTLNLAYPEPMVARDLAVRVADGALGRLRQAAGLQGQGNVLR